MKFEKSVEDRLTVIKLLEEKLDSQISPSLKSEFIHLNTTGVRNIVLNMDTVKYADSSGLSAILTANRLCKNADGVLILSNLRDHVRKLITISKLETALNILPTETEAKDAVYMAEIEREIQLQEEGDQPEATTQE